MLVGKCIHAIGNERSVAIFERRSNQRYRKSEKIREIFPREKSDTNDGITSFEMMNLEIICRTLHIAFVYVILNQQRDRSTNYKCSPHHLPFLVFTSIPTFNCP